MQYIAFIHNNVDTTPTAQEWEQFFTAAIASGIFKGGSEIGNRHVLGKQNIPDTTIKIGGFMRFDSENLEALRTLLDQHPIIKHGGSLEFCEMPISE